jgi:hypothetical protein
VSLHFRYQLQPFNRPLLSLGGRYSRPRPIIGAAIIGPVRGFAVDGLLDPGSDDTVFPEDLAAKIGIDLSQAPPGSGSGVGSGLLQLRFAEVTLRIADHNEQRQWRAWVGFTSAKLRYPLFGFAGFLQYFTATFHGDREEVKLTVNSLYTGT